MGAGPRPSLGLWGAGLAALLALSACNTGQEATTTAGVPETTAGVPDVAHAHGGVGDVALDVVFIEDGGIVQAGASAPLRGAFTNDARTPDELVRVTTPAAGSVQLLDADGRPSAQGIPIPADGEVDAVNGIARLRLDGVSFPLPATQLVPVTFEFRDAGQVTLDVPVAAPRVPAP
jgi:copper(I)-binding protein